MSQPLTEKLNRWISSNAATGRELLIGMRQRFAKERSDMAGIERIDCLCEDLLSSKGEALGTALACEVVDSLLVLDSLDYQNFFQLLHKKYGAQRKQVMEAIDTWKAEPTDTNLNSLHQLSEPRRQELFRRINMAPRGTETLVTLRSKLLDLLPDNPEFAEIDMWHLMTSWFNRGFLRLVRIDWQTSAHILEKLIAYEAVHEMDGWEDLQRRLAEDRRCFAFFHPTMADEPLIFVEVALSQGLASSVQKLLTVEKNSNLASQPDSAIFYSISDCQRGLRGISFGNFLIKQVVSELRREIPVLTFFATLSPITGFIRWLRNKVNDKKFPSLGNTLDLLSNSQSIQQADEKIREAVLRLCAEYLYSAKKGDFPLDPVARFHLKNGASIERLNWAGDLSEKGLQQSLGIMVNYRYDLKKVEVRHEQYVNHGTIAMEKAFARQLQFQASEEVFCDLVNPIT